MGDDRAMQDWPTPIRAALTVAAAAAPFVAGLGVVLWSKARARKPIAPPRAGSPE
jgi:hypothetical protein